jgi:translation initiation factor IF-2
MKGPELVRILRDLGFEKVKTHMAVLDDPDQMLIEVRLTTHGYTKTASVAESPKGPVRKKAPALRKKVGPSPKGAAAAQEEAAEETSGSSGPHRKIPQPKGSQDSAPPKKTLLKKKGPLKRKAAPEPEEKTETPAETLEKEGGLTPSKTTPPIVELEENTKPKAPPSTSPKSEKAFEEEREVGSGTKSTPQEAPETEPSSSTSAKPQRMPIERTAEETSVEASTSSEKVPSTPQLEREGSDQEKVQVPTPSGHQPPLTRTPDSTPPPSSVSGETADQSVPEEESESKETPPLAASGAPTEANGSVTSASQETSPEPPKESGSGKKKTGEDGKKKPETKGIRRLPQPERRAKILGRIELPKETIADATRRSAPGGARNPANVDRNLRQAALEQFRSRSSGGSPFRRQGSPFGRGPSGMRGGRGKGSQNKKKRNPLAPPPGIDPEKLVQVEAPVTIKKLSEALGHRVNELLVVLLRLGVKANINSYLDTDQVELVSLELNRNVEVIEEKDVEEELLEELTKEHKEIGDEGLTSRPPITTFMGHVDHGKTSLLDALRDSQVTKGEAGGITQHMGAYRVHRGDTEIVVLDTPGHEAFTAMRARGAQLTDIVILVVAADDGVMPQTEEALNHAKAAGVPIIVAVNKIDKTGANPMRIRQQLATLGLQPEDWGGTTQFVDTSAMTGQGLDELVEKIGLEAMVLELEANPDKPGSGRVVEAKQTPAQGNVISMIVLDGTLKKGDWVLVGQGTGRVRLLVDDKGKQLKEAGPGTPIEILGIPELPKPGDKFHVVKDAKAAKEVAGQRAAKIRTTILAEKSKARMADVKAQLEAKKIEEIRLIVKADVMGSLEPIRQSLEKLSNEEVRVRILHAALGGISETDVSLADASQAILIGFNSVPDEKARQRAEKANVTIRHYNVIYELIDDVKLAMEGMLAPEQKEEVRGRAEIRKVFRSSKFGNLAGCMVTNGKINRNYQIRLIRDGIVIFTGKIAGLRREKDDVRDVRENFECGIKIQNYEDIREGDQIEAFEVLEIKRTLADLD